MGSEWIEQRLGEFVRLQRGHDLTASEQQPGKIPIMGSAGPNGLHNKATTPGPGVVIGRSGASAGRVHYCPVDFWAHNTTLYVTDFIGNNPRFVYYLLGTVDLARFNSGSAQPSLNRNYIYDIKLQIPSREEQDWIADTLSALDDKIALLRETNATLEAIAQALFKSWFVDFDPVRAKAEGRDPEGVPPEVVDLFPREFEESKLGAIPKGWKVIPVYDLGQFVNGASYKAFDPNPDRRGLPIVKIAELKAGITPQTAYSDRDMPEKYRIRDRDILFSWSGNPDTSIDTFVWFRGPSWLNQHIFNVIPKEGVDRSFVLLMLKYFKPEFMRIAGHKQTTGLGHVTVADLKRLCLAKPPTLLLQAWNSFVDPLLERIFRNDLQAQSLSDLRDTLLPHLLSGKPRVAESEIPSGAIP